MKKLLSAILIVLMTLTVFVGCNKEESEGGETSEYTGVLTKLRLGMPMNKVLTLNSDVDMYYENDTEIWCVNTDTDLMELRDRIPAENQFYNVEDSLITYYFRFDETDQENYLKGYLEEVPCMVDRETAAKYYEDKKASLIAKYSVPEESVSSTITGTEDIDQTLDYITKMTLPSFEVKFTMQQTYDTVDGVEGYYGTYFSIELKELANKTPVEDKSGADE